MIEVAILSRADGRGQGLLQDEVPGNTNEHVRNVLRGVVLRYESTPIGQEGQIVAGYARQHQLVLVVDTVGQVRPNVGDEVWPTILETRTVDERSGGTSELALDHGPTEVIDGEPGRPTVLVAAHDVEDTSVHSSGLHKTGRIARELYALAQNPVESAVKLGLLFVPPEAIRLAVLPQDRSVDRPCDPLRSALVAADRRELREETRQRFIFRPLRYLDAAEIAHEGQSVELARLTTARHDLDFFDPGLAVDLRGRPLVIRDTDPPIERHRDAERCVLEPNQAKRERGPKRTDTIQVSDRDHETAALPILDRVSFCRREGVRDVFTHDDFSFLFLPPHPPRARESIG